MDNELLLLKLQQERNLCLKAHADLSYTLGIYFGYPNCCRIEFCDDVLKNNDPRQRVVGGSGFIPCRKHFVQVLLGEIKLSDLIKDRISPDPFDDRVVILSSKTPPPDNNSSSKEAD